MCDVTNIKEIVLEDNSVLDDEEITIEDENRATELLTEIIMNEVDAESSEDNDEEDLYDNDYNSNNDYMIDHIDPVRDYLKSISIYKPLTYEDEIRLAKDIQKGLKAKEELNKINNEHLEVSSEQILKLNNIIDEYRNAKEKLVNHNLRRVVGIVKRYYKKYNNSSYSLLDLIQEGNLGLITATERYDYTEGVRFGVYAAFWIKQHAIRYILNTSNTIRLPVHIIEDIYIK